MKGDDSDWQDAAFNTRHLHNRLDRGGQSGNTRHEFQVRNTFGTHLVKCATLDKLQGSSTAARNKNGGGGSGAMTASKTRRSSSSSSSKGKGSGSKDVVLDIYRLTDDQDGLLGALRCPGVFVATVVFAGSRKGLWKITHGLGGDDLVSSTTLLATNGSLSTAKEEDKKDDGDQEETSSSEDDDDDDDEEADGPSSREARQRRRVANFEKNSFRQPKFWFRWQGHVVDQDDLPPPLAGLGVAGGSKVHGSGYVVFSGNDCKRFQGTLTSEQLAWNNARMTGFKTKPQPERDFEIQWTAEP